MDLLARYFCILRFWYRHSPVGGSFVFSSISLYMFKNLWNSSAAMFVLFSSVPQPLSTFSLVNNFLSYAKQMHKVAAAFFVVLLFCFYWGIVVCTETGTSKRVSAVIRRIKSPNCLLSQESSSIFKAGADHTLNPAFSPLKLPQLSQQMVHASTHPPPSNAHS